VDIAMTSAVVSVVKWAFPKFEFDWLADEMRINLPKELGMD
jgi:ADP-heptose:LPS heptosyltransferase